jgi:hypothetical protein
MLLAAACPDTPADALAKLRIGRRDACLLTLREWTFGPELVGVTTCPGCGERLELTFGTADIRVPSHSREDDEKEGQVLSLDADGYQVRFRMPTSLDLFAIAGQELETSRRLLLHHCLLAAEHNGEEMACDQLPANVIDAVVEQMEQDDPQGDVQLALSCRVCDHHWQAAFDIVSFFWSEINAWAHRTLHEVHALASAYGWSEADILALSPWRRQTYLELVNVR